MSICSDFSTRDILDIDYVSNAFRHAEKCRIGRPYQLMLHDTVRLTDEAITFCKENNIEILYRRDE
jgi:hypothetical protein